MFQRSCEPSAWQWHRGSRSPRGPVSIFGRRDARRRGVRPPAVDSPPVTTDLRQRLQATLGAAYTLERELGGGGMSRVFVATETKLRRQVVVKVLSSDLAAGVSAERFDREIQLVASLQQANIVPLLSAGETDGIPYYTMPFVEGESLRARLATSGRLPIADAVGILRDLARALSYAHARGVVHRDIKPDNILLSHGAAVVTDFGIAKAISASRTQAGGGSTLTMAGTSIGTPAYMAPEQVAGDDAADHRVDIYAFGCVAYELLTGHTPFTETAPQKMLAAHLSKEPTPVRDERADVPGALAALVMRCLAKDAGARPQSADELLRSLEAIATPSGAFATGVETAPKRRPRLPRFVLVTAVVIVVASAVALALRGRPTATADVSIAVLPLTNLSADSTGNYFGEGLADEITGALAKAGLKVIGRGSARALAAKGLDAKAIAKELGVASVLQGNVQRAGDQVRISVSLVSGSDGSVKWTEKYDRQFKDVFAVQDELARAVVAQLRATLATGATLVHNETADPQAHTLYLQGLYLWNRRTAPALRQAVRVFEQAATRDPKYARAYAGIALAYTVLPHYTDDNADSLTALGRAAADKALALDSTLAEAWTAKAYGDTEHWNNAEADREFARAIAYDSTFATARFWHGLLLLHAGRFPEAERELSAAMRLEPASLIILTARSQFANTLGHADSSAKFARDVFALDSTYLLAKQTLGMALSYTGEHAEAARLLESVAHSPGLRTSETNGAYAWALARGGRVADARQVIAKVRRGFGSRAVPSVAFAAALAEVGDMTGAIEALQAAVTQHDPWLINYGRSPRSAKLRADPRGKALLESIEKM